MNRDHRGYRGHSAETGQTRGHLNNDATLKTGARKGVSQQQGPGVSEERRNRGLWDGIGW